MKTNVAIKGMHCASCSKIIEKTFKKVDGVNFAEVNYGLESANVEFDEKKTSLEELSKKIEPLGYSLLLETNENKVDMIKKEKLKELKELKSKVYTAIPLAIVSIFIMGWDILARFNIVAQMSLFWSEFFHHLLPIFATYVLFVIGKPYLKGALNFFKTGKANMDTLIGIGTSVAFIYSFIVTAFEESLKAFIDVSHNYYDVTIVVIAFITFGKYLEAKSKIKTGDAIEKLIGLQAKTATVIRAGLEQEISIDKVVVGDHIIIKPAGKIPVDGVIVKGSSFVDESMITGEPIPTEKKEDSQVYSGTINTTGTFTFKATKVGKDTFLSNIIKMVESAQGSKAPIQALADKISGVFVPTVLVVATVTLILWLTLGSNYIGFSKALSLGLVSFVSILVIACPCALGLATPTAIIVGVGSGAKSGILIKDATSLEKLHKANIIMVDKTGTITQGKPNVQNIINYSNKEERDLLSILYTLEKHSEHPLSHAIVEYAKHHKIESREATGFEVIKGKGLSANVHNIKFFAGSIALMKDLDLKYNYHQLEEETKRGRTPIFLSTKDHILCLVLVSDEVKKESEKAVRDLQKMGLEVIMVTGDDKNTAEYIASQVGIKTVIANALPQDKLMKVKEFQSQGKIVAMAGDGINDAPALAQADVGLAMATGTDVAIESAGITILHGDISKIDKAVKLSKNTMRTIKQNLFFAFFYNIIGIPLAAGAFYPIFGWMLSPVFAGAAMAASSVSVVTNSLMLKNKKL